MNRLDKIARRSKRVGGAIADLWGCTFMYPPVFPELSSLVDHWIGAEFYVSRGTYRVKIYHLHAFRFMILMSYTCTCRNERITTDESYIEHK